MSKKTECSEFNGIPGRKLKQLVDKAFSLEVLIRRSSVNCGSTVFDAHSVDIIARWADQTGRGQVARTGSYLITF